MSILGELFIGDQLMMVDGQSMIDITLDSAQSILKKSMEKQDVRHCMLS